MKASTHRTGFKVAVIYGLGVMAAMTVSETVTELGRIAGEFHPSDPSKIGWVMSLPSLMVATGALLAGFIVDRQGDRRVLLLGALIIALGDVLATLAPTFDLLLAARVFTGVGYVLTAVAAVTMLIRITSGKQRILAMTLWSTFVPASFVLPFLSAGLSESLGSWRAAFAGHTLVTLLLLAMALIILPKRRDEDVQQVSRSKGLSQVLKTPWPYLLGLSFGADAFLQTGTIATLSPYLASRYGVAQHIVHDFNVIAMFANAAGCLMVGALLNRGVRAVSIGLVGIVLTGVPAAAIYAYPIGLDASIVASWLFMFGSGLLVGMWALLPVVSPSRESTGATSGLVTQITLIGVFLGPPQYFAAQAAPTSGPSLTLLAIGLTVCLACGLPVWLRGNRLNLERVTPSTADEVKRTVESRIPARHG